MARSDESETPGQGTRCPAVNFLHGPVDASHEMSIIRLPPQKTV